VRDDDLVPFAVADGLLAHVPHVDGDLTAQERQYLCDRARENLAKATGETVEMAGKALAEAAFQGDAEVRVGRQFAAVVAFGRVLTVYARVELAGRVHPDLN
jgi:uncharacterized tellurite resistance protein B-like protein